MRAQADINQRSVTVHNTDPLGDISVSFGQATKEARPSIGDKQASTTVELLGGMEEKFLGQG